jgi:hypothetical protein
MIVKSFCIGVLAVALCPSIAGAAPITPTEVGLRGLGAATVVAETGAQRCWFRNGRRYCTKQAEPRSNGQRKQESDYYEMLADKLPFGSRRWWEQMARENRAGNCCN